MTPRPTSDIEQQIAELSLQKFGWKTSGQLDQLANLFDEDLSFVHLTGHVTTKNEWMDELRSGRFTYDRIEPRTATVHAHGSTAVLVGSASFTIKGGAVYDLVFTEVYVLKDAAWKLVSLHTCLDRS